MHSHAERGNEKFHQYRVAVLGAQRRVFGRKMAACMIRDAERRLMHSHAERGNENNNKNTQ